MIRYFIKCGIDAGRRMQDSIENRAFATRELQM